MLLSDSQIPQEAGGGGSFGTRALGHLAVSPAFALLRCRVF
jgi:hypothetical protein